MSFDLGEVSNFGGLTFPGSGGSGGGDLVSTFSTITVSTISAINGNFSTINLQGETLLYTYGNLVSTNSSLGYSTVTLPFRYGVKPDGSPNFTVVANYAEKAPLATGTVFPLVPVIEDISSFTLFCTNTTADYQTQWITCGFLQPTVV